LKINKIVLENIRSYTNHEIILPEGSTLLWGNIGSGKSSILLAVDFALFGLQRGNLTGASLLRNGESQGTVELYFEVEGKEIIIKRALKRSKSSISQDSGYIIQNGIKEEKTALELKQKILEILNYPKELLTKNKSLIYRYTVYTPQDEMKNILLGPKEDRLDTLRKVFGVDKYKRIKQNARVVLSSLKNKKKLYEGMAADLPDKIIDKEFKEKEKILLQDKLEELKPTLIELEDKIKSKKQEIKEAEEKKEKINELKKKIELLHVSLNHLLNKKEEDEKKLNRLNLQINEAQKEELILEENIKERIIQKEQDLQTKEKELREILDTIQEKKVKIQYSQILKDKISKIDNCPTCLQEVTPNHKQTISHKCDQEIDQFREKSTEHYTFQQETDQKIKNFKEEIQNLRKKEAQIQLVKHKIKELEIKRKEAKEIELKKSDTRLKIEETNSKILALQDQLGQIIIIEQIFSRQKEELNFLEQKYNQTNIEKHKIDATLKPLDLILSNLEEEIRKKMKIKDKKELIGQTLFWFASTFIPLMDTMEQSILLKVHSEFNALFEKWFSILIDNQTISMRLDEDYSPRIWQNGYDISYEFLSGGEKTAGALAYRLALNQVINNLNTGLKTKDLLILDEPTDGFSNEQLDRLRILMDEINIPQIIIVSHEPLIESFVDNIVKLEKIDHVTSRI
jgi:DNA repair protein SbcC/Rad50